jgi:hypothetical protein
MKVEKVLAIEGNRVSEVYQNKNIIVYQTSEGYDYSATLYFVNKSNDEVMFKQRIDADCGQNVGYISSINFTGL